MSGRSADGDAAADRTAPAAALAGLLPWPQRNAVGALLPEQDAATLRHLSQAGTGANTLRAVLSDLAYLERWSLAATGGPLPWPASAALAVRFVAHHLYDPAQKETDPAHGMPEDVTDSLRRDGALRIRGPHAPATVRRRLALWSSLHRWRGLEGPFGEPGVRAALRLAVRAARRPRERKSARAVTADILDRLLGTCRGDSATDLRDRALLLVAFCSGGRRRSEVAALRVEAIRREEDLPGGPGESPLPARRLMLGRTKTSDADDDASAWLIGRPVVALEAWLARAGIARGPVFRAIDRWERIGDSALSAQAVNLIVKRRAALAGLDPALYSAHGLRSGFLTEAARQGVPLPEAMAQSQHRSISQAARYYNDAERKMGKAARLLG
jgi:integrase